MSKLLKPDHPTNLKLNQILNLMSHLKITILPDCNGRIALVVDDEHGTFRLIGTDYEEDDVPCEFGKDMDDFNLQEL